MITNEALSEELLQELEDQKSHREEEEKREWKAKLRKEYLKYKINALISIDQIILVSIIYNITQILSDFNILLYTINTENIIETFFLLLITNKFKSIENAKTNSILQLLSRLLSRIKYNFIMLVSSLFLYFVTGVITLQDEVLDGWDKMADR